MFVQILTRSLPYALLAILISAGTATATNIWYEPTDGELSDDYLNPTALTLTYGAGGDDIFFQTPESLTTDRDYFTITVASGYELSSLVLTQFDTSPSTNLGFIAVSSGASFATPPASPNPALLLGYALVGTAHVGTDILDDLGAAAGTIGFSGALGSGTYSFWAQDNTAFDEDWTLTFVTSPIPEPSTGLLMGLGLVGLSARRRALRA